MAEHVPTEAVQEDARGGHQEDREEVLPLGTSLRFGLVNPSSLLYWKCNFPMTRSVCLSLGMTGLLVIVS